MDYTLTYLIELGRTIGSFLKSFSNFLLTPIYDLPVPPIPNPTWYAFLALVRVLDPTDSISVFSLFITFGIVLFIIVSLVKWVADIIT